MGSKDQTQLLGFLGHDLIDWGILPALILVFTKFRNDPRNSFMLASSLIF